MHDLIIPAVVFLPHILQQPVEQVQLKAPDGAECPIYIAPEGPHWTAFDEAADAYFNYTLSVRAQGAAELYDLNASRRLIYLTPQADEGYYVIEDTVAKTTIALVVNSPVAITLTVDGQPYQLQVVTA